MSNWKRVHGTNGKLQAFGFCDFVFEESAMRAMRILHDLEVCDKKLLVKVDAKTQERLEKFIKDKKLPGTVSSEAVSSESKDKDQKSEPDEDSESKTENGDSIKSESKNVTNGKQAKNFSEFLDDATRSEDEILIDDIQKLLSETKFEQKVDKTEQSKDQQEQKSDGPKPDVSISLF